MSESCHNLFVETKRKIQINRTTQKQQKNIAKRLLLNFENTQLKNPTKESTMDFASSIDQAHWDISFYYETLKPKFKNSIYLKS